MRDLQDLEVHYKYVLVVAQVIHCEAMYYACWLGCLRQVSESFSCHFFSCQLKQLFTRRISQETL